MVRRRNWMPGHKWFWIEKKDLEIELTQCAEEGKEIPERLMRRITAAMESDLAEPENQQEAEAIFDETIALPLKTGFNYVEPNELDEIKRHRPSAPKLPAKPDGAALHDKVLGAWQGRAAGCLLGKPVECRKSWQIEKYLKAQNRWPLSNYFSCKASEELAKECDINIKETSLFEEGITCMVEDDDTNYTVTGLVILKKHGAAFTPEDVASFWLNYLPVLHVCTAERVAYRNLVGMIPPPESASCRNPYREWIGAQIRADFFGYCNPGKPERAAEFAWRDASISHVKNGIYGEMWVAAMLAAAFTCVDSKTVIRAGLSQIPKQCRLAENIEKAVRLHEQGTSWDGMIADIRSRWDENKGHDWCHTISNAEVVAAALLWGQMDFEKTICLSVMPGFDTDCNGATAGSVLGAMLGAARLPAKWITPLRDTLKTGIANYEQVSLSKMAEETLEILRTIH